MNPNPPNQFQKGNTIGRKGGRPRKDQGVTEWMRHRLKQPVSAEDRRAAIQAMTDVAVKQALAGDVVWAKLAFDRAFGAVAQQHELSGPGGGPVETTVRYVNDWRHADED